MEVFAVKALIVLMLLSGLFSSYKDSKHPSPRYRDGFFMAFFWGCVNCAFILLMGSGIVASIIFLFKG